MKIPTKRKSPTPRKPTFTMVIDALLRERLDRHRDVNWSSVCRAAMVRALDRLEARR